MHKLNWLPPCKYCGGSAHVEIDCDKMIALDEEVSGFFYVRCTNCLTFVKESLHPGPYQSFSKVCKKWIKANAGMDISDLNKWIKEHRK